MSTAMSAVTKVSPSVTSSACTDSFIVSDGTRIAYKTSGPASSPHKVLLIMGFLTDGAAWALQAEYLSSRGFHVVFYDNRGVAKSSTPGYTQLGSYTTKRMARDALELCSHLQWTKFHVVGVSMGGMIALEIALRSPERIQSLSLAVTHAGGAGSIVPWQGFRRMIVSMFTRSSSARLEAIMNMLYSKATLADKALEGKLRAYHIERIKTRIAPSFAALLGHTLAVHLHWVSYANLLRVRYARFPTQVIVGDEDHLVRMSNSHMLARVLGAKLQVVHNGGHGLFAEHPDKVNHMLEDFFRQADSKQQDRASSVSPSSSPDDATDDAEAAAAQSLGEDATSDLLGASPYSLEERAVCLACSHSSHCVFHALWGFAKAFVPAAAFRYVFWSSVAAAGASASGLAATAAATAAAAAANASGSSGPAQLESYTRVQQAVRFGLLVGSLRAAFRALQCLVHTLRARQWALKHKLLQPRARKAPRNAQAGDQDAKKEEETADSRAGIPRGVGFGFPWHSVLLLAACGGLIWQQKLLHGILAQ